MTSASGKHTDRTTADHPLRREVPSTVALLADEADFAAMRRYPSFPFDDHTAYLQQVETLLRLLAAQGVPTTIALFDPAEYEEFCADSRLDPDTPGSRTRYTVQLPGTGATITYTGQPLPQLLPLLIDESERRATWDCATALLSHAGHCAECDEDIAHASFQRATLALTGLLDALSEGSHHLVCSVPVADTPLLAVLHAECGNDDRPRLAEPDALLFCTVLAAGIALHGPGGVVSRTIGDGEDDTVRGWSLRGAWLQPLTSAEVFTAYCTDADTGEPVPPEPGVDYRPGIALPPPPPDHPHH